MGVIRATYRIVRTEESMEQLMPTATRTEAPPAWKGRAVLLLCFVTIVFDGYDLVIYGSTVPSILKYQEWGLTTAQAGVIGSLALIGMLLGTMSVGVLTDRLGRRRIMLASITVFFDLYAGQRFFTVCRSVRRTAVSYRARPGRRCPHMYRSDC